MKHKKSHYIENGIYLDTTTGKKYIPKGKCCICGAEHGIQIHHFIEQQRCFRDLETVKTKTLRTLTQEQINEKQKLFELCDKCHNMVHNLGDFEFWDITRLNREDFIYKN